MDDESKDFVKEPLRKRSPTYVDLVQLQMYLFYSILSDKFHNRLSVIVKYSDNIINL